MLNGHQAHLGISHAENRYRSGQDLALGRLMPNLGGPY